MTLIRRYPLVTFFVFAYALSWILWIPVVAAGQQVSPVAGLLLIIIGGFGPFLSAIIVTAIVQRKAGLRELRNRIFKWRVGIIWYLFVLSSPIVFALASYCLYILLGGAPQDLSGLQPWYNYFPAILYVFFLGGGQEEPGWRGFALPRLQAKYSALVASVILGLFWAFWHFPLFFSAVSSQSSLPFVWYLPHCIALAIIFTWIYNGTGGSVLLAMMFHAGLNAVTSWIPISATEGAISQFVAMVIVEWLIVIILILVYGPTHLSRRSRPMEHN